MDKFKDEQKYFEECILRNDDDEIEKFYNVFKYKGNLGRGGFGYVIAARFIKMDNSLVAVKIVPKNKKDTTKFDYLRKEYKLLRKIRHENIIKPVDCLETSQNIYIVLELMKGGSLYRMIKRYKKVKKQIEEDTMRVIAKGIFSALKYLHGKNIVHRDLKPENLLFAMKGVHTSVKIADFGLSISTGIIHLMPLYARCGTREYMAPEMFQKDRHYTRIVDIWSVGVILYNMITLGDKPVFKEDAKLDQKKLQEIVDKRIDGLKYISEGLRDLLSRLLVVNPLKRYKAHLALEHPWIHNASYPPPLLLYQEEGRFHHTQYLKKTFKILKILNFLGALKSKKRKKKPMMKLNLGDLEKLPLLVNLSRNGKSQIKSKRSNQSERKKKKTFMLNLNTYTPMNIRDKTRFNSKKIRANPNIKMNSFSRKVKFELSKKAQKIKKDNTLFSSVIIHDEKSTMRFKSSFEVLNKNSKSLHRTKDFQSNAPPQRKRFKIKKDSFCEKKNSKKKKVTKNFGSSGLKGRCRNAAGLKARFKSIQARRDISFGHYLKPRHELPNLSGATRKKKIKFNFKKFDL